MWIDLTAAIARIAPLFAFPLIGVLSLVPGEMRPHSGLPGQAEHFLAYFLVSVALCIQKRGWINRSALVAAVCLYAAVLEILQIWIPGRHAQFRDFAASASGAIGGYILALVIIRFLQVRNRNST
jgi:VanZ family protein